jgi:two-component system LytT family response regulator
MKPMSQIDYQKYKTFSSKIKFCTKERIVFYDPEEIIYCEAEQNYTYLHIKDNTRLLVSKNIGLLEQKLAPFGFFRISRSALINLRYLKYINRQQKVCFLETDRQYRLKTSGKRISELELYYGFI